MGGTKFLVRIVQQRGKHTAVVHVMSVDKELVGSVQAAPLIEKGQAIVRVVPLKIVL